MVFNACVNQLMQNDIISQFRRQDSQFSIKINVLLSGAAPPPGFLLPDRDFTVLDMDFGRKVLQSVDEQIFYFL